MSKGKQKETAKAPEQSEAKPTSVLGRTWDPADPALNNNGDQPVFVSPKAIPHNQSSFAGTQDHREGAGESRPMFSSSLKEY